jgi:hormone-sensitive lipase
LNSYIKDAELKPLEDPLICPLKASDELLSEFPPSYIITGDNDPLHDDSLRMAQKLM